MIGPTLTTERLILRPLAREDFPAFAKMHADPDVMRFVGGVQVPSVAWRSLALFAGGWVLNGFSLFSVLERATGQWVGRVGPWRPEGYPMGEVAWTLARESWGKGYATEAARAAIDFAFEKLGWSEVMHCIELANTPSICLAERVGSVHRGPIALPAPYENQGHHAWVQTR
jgi:RimJ/RimL family protein N-acetyltransferase